MELILLVTPVDNVYVEPGLTTLTTLVMFVIPLVNVVLDHPITNALNVMLVTIYITDNV
jgi:hypothetical protein